MPYIILLCGYTAVGKSTLSKYLSEKLNIKTLHSAVIRNGLNISVNQKESVSVFDFNTNKRGKMDDKVYGEIVKKAEEYISNNKSVIIDAGNFYKSRRKKYYNIGKKYRIGILIINVICSDELLIKQRLNNRLKNYEDSVFNEAASINIYNSTKLIMENPMDDFKSKNSLPDILQYDTALNRVKIINKQSNNFDLIINYLKNYCFTN